MIIRLARRNKIFEDFRRRIDSMPKMRRYQELRVLGIQKRQCFQVFFSRLQLNQHNLHIIQSKLQIWQKADAQAELISLTPKLVPLPKLKAVVVDYDNHYLDKIQQKPLFIHQQSYLQIVALLNSMGEKEMLKRLKMKRQGDMSSLAMCLLKREGIANKETGLRLRHIKKFNLINFMSVINNMVDQNYLQCFIFIYKPVYVINLILQQVYDSFLAIAKDDYKKIIKLILFLFEVSSFVQDPAKCLQMISSLKPLVQALDVYSLEFNEKLKFLQLNLQFYYALQSFACNVQNLQYTLAELKVRIKFLSFNELMLVVRLINILNSKLTLSQLRDLTMVLQGQTSLIKHSSVQAFGQIAELIINLKLQVKLQRQARNQAEEQLIVLLNKSLNNCSGYDCGSFVSAEDLKGELCLFLGNHEQDRSQGASRQEVEDSDLYEVFCAFFLRLAQLYRHRNQQRHGDAADEPETVDFGLKDLAGVEADKGQAKEKGHDHDRDVNLFDLLDVKGKVEDEETLLQKQVVVDDFLRLLLPQLELQPEQSQSYEGLVQVQLKIHRGGDDSQAQEEVAGVNLEEPEHKVGEWLTQVVVIEEKEDRGRDNKALLMIGFEQKEGRQYCNQHIFFNLDDFVQEADVLQNKVDDQQDLPVHF